MKLLTLTKTARILALAGLIGAGISAVIPRAASVNPPAVRALQVVDGSESTGKPPKPHGRFFMGTERALIADGSESTSKPPKPKNNA